MNVAALALAPHVLVVDDDTRLRGLLARYLGEQGFVVTTARDAEDARAKMKSLAFDLMVLDVMMPGENGFELTRALRQGAAEARPLPILLLTAKGETDDRIEGLEAGADDYLMKPFEPRELLLRINAILRRAQQSGEQNNSPNSIAVSNVTLYPAKRQATIGEAPLELTSTEFNLLEVLMRHAGQVVSKETLSIEALDRKLAKFDRSIDVHISSIRHKLGDASLIQTVRGLGYLFVKN